MTLTSEEFAAQALIEMSTDLPTDHIPWWFELVRRQLSHRDQAERRAYVLSHAAHLWEESKRND